MPPKFDDFKKAANDVLGDDFFTAGYEFKSKAQTPGASKTHATTTIEFSPAAEKPVSTGKIHLKIPNPAGLTGIAIHKIEMDKKGNFKLEGEISEKLHRVPHLKLEPKLPNVQDITGVTAGLTFHGLKMNIANQAIELQIKADVLPMAPDKSMFEITKSVGPMALFGVKAGLSNLTSPSVACRFGSNGAFAALAMKQDPKGPQIDAHAFYKVKVPSGLGIISGQEIKFGACACKKGAAAPSLGLGLHWEVMKGAHLKAKVEQSVDKDKQMNSCSFSAKYPISQGCVLIGAAKLSPDKPTTVGFQLNVE